MLLAAGICLSACSDDDKDRPDQPTGGTGTIPELPAPPYADDAAMYVAESANTTFSSIEMTASGEFIIVRNLQSWYSPLKAHKNGRLSHLLPWHTPSLSRATEQNGIICGKFTKISDTEYILDGFGTIVIEGDSSNSINIIVTTLTGETYTIATRKASEYPDSEVTAAISRSWNLNEIGLNVSINGKSLFKDRRPSSQYWKMVYDAQVALANWINSMMDDPEDYVYPQQIEYDFYPTGLLFSRAGTYMVSYSNSVIALATWHWVDETNRKFHFSWDYNDNTTNIFGVAADAFVSFEGPTLVITEPNQDSEDGITMRSETTYYCNSL